MTRIERIFADICNGLRFQFIRVDPLRSDFIHACALKRFGVQARSIAFDFLRVFLCPQRLHYCGKPESATLQKTDQPAFVPITRR